VNESDRADTDHGDRIARPKSGWARHP
jgi:hypothetical protein